MKKGRVLLRIFLLVVVTSLVLTVVNAQLDDPERIQQIATDTTNLVNNTINVVGNINVTFSNHSLNNTIFGKVENTFQKAPFLFTLFFGEPFSSTLRFLLIVMFTVFFFFFVKSIIFLVVPFNRFVCWMMLIGLTIGVAYSKAFVSLAGVIETFILVFPWWAKVLTLIVLVIIAVLIEKLFKPLINKIKEKKKTQEEIDKKNQLDYQLKLAENTINPYVEALSKVSGIKSPERVDFSNIVSKDGKSRFIISPNHYVDTRKENKNSTSEEDDNLRRD